MAAKKVLQQVAGQLTEYAGKVTGGGDGDFIALDATGRIDSSYMPVGVEVESQTVLSSEVIASGAFVNLWLTGGVLKVRNADNTAAGKEAHGFVLSGVGSGVNATVFRKGLNTGLAGMTIGAKQYLGAAGVRTETPPSSTGNVVQYLGVADSATEAYFLERLTIVLA